MSKTEFSTPTQAQAHTVLLALAIGDAMGQAVETMTHAAILEATDTRGVTGMVESLAAAPGSRHWRPAGTTTDDFQLTRAVAEALVEAGGFDLEVLARHHVRAAQASTSGWGTTTKRAVEELERFELSAGRSGRSPLEPVPHVPGAGGGNGVAMKVAPLVLQRRPNPMLLDEVTALARLTHGDPDAAWCAYAYARALELLLERERPLVAADARDFLTGLASELSDPAADPTRDAVLHAASLAGDVDALRERVTPGFTALTSVPYSLGVALSLVGDFEAAVLTAVNAGGDADSTAALVGTLVAANLGPGSVPQRWADALADPGAPLEVARLLCP
jgi:ADP-ribosylglycohydrolase